MAPTRELSAETMERVLKLLQEGSPAECGKRFRFQSAVFKIRSQKQTIWEGCKRETYGSTREVIKAAGQKTCDMYHDMSVK